MTCWRATASRPAGLVSDPVQDAFTRQLSAPGYVLDLRPRPARHGHRDGPDPDRGPDPRAGDGRPAQRRAERPAGEPRTGEPRTGEPCVLLLSRSRDGEFDAVASLLARVGVPVARLDADRLETVDLLADADRAAVRLNGAWLAPTVTWDRHFSAQAIATTGDPVRDLLRRQSWDAIASQIGVFARTSIGSHRVALLEQQALARRYRIAVPRTVVTTRPAQAAELIGAKRLVIKAADQHFVEAAPGRLSGVFPVIVPHQHSRADEKPPPAGYRAGPAVPVIVQEYVEHDAELRVYYIDGEVLGFEVGKESPSDLWLAIARVEVRPAELPSPVVSATRTLAAGLELRFGAFDFLVRDGSPVFLEANPDGDWHWAEQKSATRQITMAAAAMLRRLHHAARQDSGPQPSRPRDTFNLLRFLSQGNPGNRAVRD
jgi:hypothetical protein